MAINNNPDASTGLDWNLGTMQLGLGGLNTIGNLYTGLQSLSLANKQYDMQKYFANQNLNNTIKSYNTTLTDKANARAAQNGTDAATVAAYIDQNKMVRS